MILDGFMIQQLVLAFSRYRDVDAENNVFASKSWFMGGPDFDREVISTLR